jgi:hypothetical protein
VVNGSGMTSHFIYRDPEHILAWSSYPLYHGGKCKAAFCLFEDKQGGKVELVGPDVMTEDGHCTYLPGNAYIVNDTYPDKKRNKNVFLYHVATGKVIPLGHFHQPPGYDQEFRCDTHPRISPDGKTIVVDAPYKDQGRQLHLIDIRGIVG